MLSYRGDVGLLGENKWFLGKMNGLLEEQMGGMIIYGKVCCVWCGLIVPSLVIQVNNPWLMKFQARAFVTVGFLLEDLSVGR